MSQNDGITDDIRKREDDYFRRKDRELVERMRKASEAAQARMAIETQTGIHDPELLRDLEELGFTPETVALLPLIPVLQVAWAEGGVSGPERSAILELAKTRGITPESAAGRRLADWLEHRPSSDTFRKAMRLIAAMLDHQAPGTTDTTAEDLIKYCEKIAAASGGLFGIGAVSAPERSALEDIASRLKKR